tara:strand:+ start:352 stop:669 length:318 start_codon:yes stop_codon:yes gene_type:complete
MKDSKRRSLYESVFDVVTGFLIYLPINYFVLPYFTTGIDEHNIATMLSISLIYTSIALARKYTIRRWFVDLKHKRSKKNMIDFQSNEWAIYVNQELDENNRFELK